MITGVQDVYYNVENMERAVAFYRDVLGMRVLDSNPWWTSLECFGARIGLHGNEGRPLVSTPRDPHGASTGAHTGATLTLRSTDLDADIEYLGRNGVAIVSTSNSPWGRIAVFLDTEGNALKLMQAVK